MQKCAFPLSTACSETLPRDAEGLLRFPCFSTKEVQAASLGCPALAGAALALAPPGHPELRSTTVDVDGRER